MGAGVRRTRSDIGSALRPGDGPQLPVPVSMGMEPQLFRIAGLLFSIQVDDERVLEASTRNWRAFRSEAAEVRSSVAVRVDQRAPFRGLVRELVQAVRSASGGWNANGEDFSALVSPDRRRATMVQAADPYPPTMVVKLLIALELINANGLLCHGVGFSHDRHGALFVGESGAGKSTLGELTSAGGLFRHSDELVAARLTDQGAEIEGTPWNIGQPGKAVLKMIGLLAHGPEHRIDDIPASEVLRVLFQNSLVPDSEPSTRHRMFAIASQLLSRVRTVRLTFAKDVGVADVLRRELSRSP